MNRLICSILLSALSIFTVAHAKPLLSSPGASSLANIGRHTPLVKGFGYSGSLFDLSGYGASYKFSVDVFLGYLMDVFNINVLVD